MALEQQSGLLKHFDGVMGMWSGVNGSTEGLIVPHLYDQGIISRNMFSFFFSNDKNGSYIDLGAPNPAAMNSEDEIIWIDVSN